MENPMPVGFRFRPSDEEIVDHYLRLKNLGGTSVDEAISTVNIYSFDPWDLPSQSMMIESRDQVWYFFGRKENEYNRGERRSRKTKSGFWKKTGVTMDISRKRDKIGEKRVFVFHFSKILGGSKSDWVMHEYVATSLSPPNQMMTYTLCKVKFKGEDRIFGGIEHRHSLITTGGFSTGSQGSSFDCLHGQELENPRQFSGFLDVQEEAQLEDAMRGAINNLSADDFNSLLNHDDEEQGKITFMQEDRSDYTPKTSLTGVFIGHSSDDDSDSDSISVTTSSIHTSSTCDSFGSSNRRTDKIKDLQKSPNSTIKLLPLTQEVSKTQGTVIDTSEIKNPHDDVQEVEMGEHQLGQETIKNKRAGFFYRIIQRLVKKFHLCASISRT